MVNHSIRKFEGLVMKSSPLVSVIVTCYNQGKYLNKALDSILDQSYTHWECWIIDDGSTDNTRTVSVDYHSKDSRFQYVFQENSGVAAARNRGIQKCNGEFIQFLDADDFIHQDKFLTQLEQFEKNPEIDVLYGSSRYFFDDEPTVFYPLHFRGSIPCDLSYRDKFQVEMLLKHNVCTNCAGLFKRKIISKVSFKKQIYEDWIFNLECALNGFVFHFDNSFLSYSYIRITGTGQMMKHTNQLADVRRLESTLGNLVKGYGYKISTKIIVSEESNRSSDLVYLIKQICPPVIFRLLSELKTTYLGWKFYK